MELHQALRNIVKTDGPSIITESKLINILSDFQAFDSLPASKYVTRAIIDDGYSKRLLACKKWDSSAQQVSHQFALNTGFQLDLVNKIFQSLAYGLGWLNSIDNSITNQSAPIVPTQPSTRPKLGKNPTAQEANKYFTSLIERKPESEKALGVEFSKINCSGYDLFDDCFYFDCNVEVSGKILDPCLLIKVVTFTTDGSIFKVDEKAVPQLDLKGYGIYRILCRMEGITPNEIERILVYAE